jgi:hypothetical protein
LKEGGEREKTTRARGMERQRRTRMGEQDWDGDVKERKQGVNNCHQGNRQEIHLYDGKT